MADLAAVYPLQNESIDKPSFQVRESQDYGLIRLQVFRHQSAEQVASLLTMALPGPGKFFTDSERQIFWAAPGEWILCIPRDQQYSVLALMQEKLPSDLGVVTLMSDSRTALLIDGDRHTDVLARGCSVDLHPSVFGAGCCLSARLANVPVMLAHREDGSLLLFVCRSLAAYLLEWLAANSRDL